MQQTYLSPEYFAFFKQFAEEARQRDLRIWIVDDIGYPSGFAGGKFTREKPNLRMQTLAIAQRLTLNAGDVLNQPVTPDTVAVTAIGPNAAAIDIPIHKNRISWTAPAG